MSTLSIMIDEAGNFDMSTTCDPLYCITLVFHNQDDDITDAIDGFDSIQRQKGFNPEKAVHVSPLIRKEPPYAEMDKNERKSLFTATASFIQRLPIRYKAFMFDKKQSGSYNAFIAKMISSFNSFIRTNLNYFQQFDKIRIFYDRGQQEVSLLLNSTFVEIFPNTEMKLAFQNDYKLLQVADYICTLEFAKEKWERGMETKSVVDFFGTRRVFIRNYYNNLRKFQF